MSAGSSSAPNPNTIPPLPQAVSTILAYPLAKTRKDMPMQEYINYKYNWDLFNTVWAYNYTVSTLNGQGRGLADYYQFQTYKDYTSYKDGQIAHMQVYSNAPSGQFESIHPS